MELTNTIDEKNNVLNRAFTDFSLKSKLDETFKLCINIKNPYLKDTFEYDYVEHFCNGVPMGKVEPFLEVRRHFEKYGKYTNFIRNSHPHSKYMKFWEEEKRKCIEGVTINGMFVTGYNYFYWNYTRIILVEDISDGIHNVTNSKKKSKRLESFPDIYDTDYFFFRYMEECENRGTHAASIKKRGWGYSFKVASMVCRNYHLIKGSKSFIIADIKEFLLKDGTITKVDNMKAFLNEHTAWGKRSQYKDTDIWKRASYKKKQNGIWTESGYKSEIMGVVTNGDSDVLRGKRGKLSAYEEVGVNKVFRQSWVVQKSSVEEGDFVYGTMLASGTGGTEGADFEGLREVIDNPEAYFVLPVPDIFGGDVTRKRGMFIPAYTSVKGFYDKDGNSDIMNCALHLQKTRHQLRNNDISNLYIRFCAEHPFTVEEAVLKVEGGLFDIMTIRDRISDIQTGKVKILEYKGKFIRTGEGTVEFREELNANPITQYPINSAQLDISGCWVIWEHPHKEEILRSDNSVVKESPYNRYILCCDPIDIGTEESADSTKEHSLAASFVIDTWTRRIVAEYTGRPPQATDYYLQLILACEYYNGQVMYERNRSNFYTYCLNNNLTHWLADEPQSLKEKFGTSNGKNLKGVYSIKKHQGKEYIQSWHLEPVSIDEVTFTNRIHTIKSIPLLQELELYKLDRNCDRISALGIGMIFLFDINYKEVEISKKINTIFDDKFFKNIHKRVNNNNKILNYGI